MSYWDGTRWVSDSVDRPTGAHRAKWPATLLMVIGLVALAIPMQLVSAGGRGHANAGDPACTTSASDVAVGETFWLSAAGLPKDSAINLWVTDSRGTSGSPLGGTADGTFHMQESVAVSGTTTYAFSGPQRGNMAIYLTCSVEGR